METLTFWEKWKVFIFGLIGAIAITLQAAFTELGEGQDTKVYLYAALMAALSFVATAWRGQGVSITGIVGTLAGVFVTMQTGGNFTWNQFIVSAILAVLSAVAPPPKALTYERNENIVNAKQATDQVEDTSHISIGVTDIRNNSHQ